SLNAAAAGVCLPAPGLRAVTAKPAVGRDNRPTAAASGPNTIVFRTSKETFFRISIGDSIVLAL
ncbi:MAG TPA: hypothetical protein VLL57_07905, partial [Candidatus Binataceae bacterium]|nr:hypothetical protein [Candidatus Binataceae bacterium]